ncbi:Non-LTR retroelement reverse transcriptase [Sesbania bispinosa]|nr:Non-LTR retroelement reverse transcriptase [Sesbania bispinosa]
MQDTRLGDANTNQPATSPFGPWMLVKKQSRKKQNAMDQSRKPSVVQDIQKNGSRFSLLNNIEPEVTQGDKGNQNSPIPTASIVRVRDPRAGKNAQNVQVKKQTPRKIEESNSQQQIKGQAHQMKGVSNHQVKQSQSNNKEVSNSDQVSFE